MLYEDAESENNLFGVFMRKKPKRGRYLFSFGTPYKLINLVKCFSTEVQEGSATEARAQERPRAPKARAPHALARMSGARARSDDRRRGKRKSQRRSRKKQKRSKHIMTGVLARKTQKIAK